MTHGGECRKASCERKAARARPARTRQGKAVADGNRQRILVVEDDAELREEMLRPGLQEAGYVTVGVGSAMEAYRAMLSQDYSMFIVDVGLPDEDGLTLAGHLRALTSHAGIIMLTGRLRSNQDHVRGLDQGADAYITKPVDIEVLAATVRSILRRQARVAAPQHALTATGWELDMAGWCLVAPDGGRVRLTHAERVLLDLLFASPSETVSRKTLVAHLTRDIHDFDPHRLEMLVHRLRRKALAEAGAKLPLNAVRGVGYVLTPS